MGTVSLKSEAASRSIGMLRTAMGAITSWLDDPAIVEVMLNPDGRLWIDRLAGGLSDRSDWRRKTASASCVSSPTLSAPRCIPDRRVFRPNDGGRS